MLIFFFESSKIDCISGQIFKWWSTLYPKYKGIRRSWRQHIWIELLSRNPPTTIKEDDITCKIHLTFIPCLALKMKQNGDKFGGWMQQTVGWRLPMSMT